MLVMFGVACGNPAGDAEGQTWYPTASWRRADPESVGVSSAAIASIVQRAGNGTIADMSSLLIVRHGYLVAEHYFNGSSEGDIHTMQSVSKSVTSLITGIAVDQGRLATTSSLFGILPEYAAQATDPAKAAITIGDLLAMRSGINFYESPYAGSPLEQLNNSAGDWVPIALAPPMNAMPGQRWQYNSGGVILIAAAVRRAAGQAFDAWAQERLFTPLGITTERWFVSPYDSLAHAGGGLRLRATDLARIGYLVLHHGVWNDEQIVSRRWLDESLRPRSVRNAFFGSHATDYGYLWWLLPIDPNRPTSDPANVVYTASGNLMQWLFVVPRYDLVVVVTGRGNSNFSAPVDFLFNDILATLRN